MIDKPVMIITGTRKGIGKYLAEYYTEKGFIVIGCSRGDINFALNNYQHYCLDVCDESLLKKMFREIRKKYGRLDVLINNAGLASENHVLLTPLKEAHDSLNTNFIGTFMCCRESVKLMKINQHGRIINISSIHVPLASAGTSIYGASKAAIEQFSRVLAREIFQFGITINILSLSVVKDTGMEIALTEEIKRNILNQTISKDQLNIYDVIHAVNFLIDEKSKMVSNQILCLGGV
jgi:3-oxoacyl-[acyl-carrier protein] reductase